MSLTLTKNKKGDAKQKKRIKETFRKRFLIFIHRNT